MRIIREIGNQPMAEEGRVGLLALEGEHEAPTMWAVSVFAEENSLPGANAESPSADWIAAWSARCRFIIGEGRLHMSGHVVAGAFDGVRA